MKKNNKEIVIQVSQECHAKFEYLKEEKFYDISREEMCEMAMEAGLEQLEMRDTSADWEWMYLSLDFFERTEIKYIEKSAGGDELIIIFMKIQILSLKKVGNEGYIPFRNICDSIEEEIALDIDSTPEKVRQTIETFAQFGYLERIMLDGKTYAINVYELYYGDNNIEKHKNKLKLRKMLIEHSKIIPASSFDILKRGIINNDICNERALKDILEKMRKK